MKSFFTVAGLLLSFILLAVTTGCGGGSDYTPKPKGYMRIDMPSHSYAVYDTSALPFVFDVSSNAVVDLKRDQSRLKWVDINYPQVNGVIYLTYIPLRKHGDLEGQVDTSSLLLSKHFGFSSGVDERLWVNKDQNVFATSYLLKGSSVASTYQFWATDSLSHFLRGSLYINCVPNNDSLAPVLEYLHRDMDHIIETLRWRR